MKTQKCLQARSRAPHHGHHEVHADLTETYCPGEPSLVERVYKALDRPYKFSMLVSDGHLADMLDERLASLYKQLRTRDRKITKLTKASKVYCLLLDEGYAGHFGYPEFYSSIDEAIQHSNQPDRSQWTFTEDEATWDLYTIFRVRAES